MAVFKGPQQRNNVLCVLADLEGEEQLVPIEDLKSELFKVTPILEKGAIKFHNGKGQWTIGLQVEEIKIRKLPEIRQEKPLLKFAHKLI